MTSTRSEARIVVAGHVCLDVIPPFLGAASEDAHARIDEERAERWQRVHGRDPAISLAVGTAVHRALESLDLDAAPDDAIARARAGLGPSLEALVPGLLGASAER